MFRRQLLAGWFKLLVPVSLGVLLAGCSSNAVTGTPVLTTLPTQAVKTAPPAATDAPPAEKAPPFFEEAECEFTVPSGAEVICGYLTVLEEHDQPGGETIQLHAAIFISTGANPEPDPVVHLVGGPGGSLLDTAEFYLHAGGYDILESRDYIMFNQRGTRYARPELACPDYPGYVWELAEQDLSSSEKENLLGEKLLECHDRLLAEGINLSAYNSVENAADVNDLRLALGYEQVNLYGISYGTRLALTVMRDYPEGVRSAIIDSVYPPQVDLFSSISLNANRAFQTLFEGCAADEVCREANPDLEETFYRVVEQLNATPEKLTLTGPDRSYEVVITGDMFMSTIFGMMYRTDAIPYIPLLIHHAGEGNLQPMAQAFAISLDESGISWPMYHSLQCREEIPFEDYEDALEQAAGLPPALVGYFLTPHPYEMCLTWQSGEADPIEDQPVSSAIPTFVVAGQYDPITPPDWARLAAETLDNSYFYEFPGIGHGVIRSNGCALSIALAFLDDPTTEPDAACIGELAGPSF